MKIVKIEYLVAVDRIGTEKKQMSQKNNNRNSSTFWNQSVLSVRGGRVFEGCCIAGGERGWTDGSVGDWEGIEEDGGEGDDVVDGAVVGADVVTGVVEGAVNVKRRKKWVVINKKDFKVIILHGW